MKKKTKIKKNKLKKKPAVAKAMARQGITAKKSRVVKKTRVLATKKKSRKLKSKITAIKEEEPAFIFDSTKNKTDTLFTPVAVPPERDPADAGKIFEQELKDFGAVFCSEENISPVIPGLTRDPESVHKPLDSGSKAGMTPWNKIWSVIKKPFRNLFGSILIGLITAGLFSTVFYALATWSGSPYAPGETTNPECDPAVTDCTVTASVPYTGATAALNLGTRNFTTTGTGSFASLTLTTSALTVGNGGIGISTIPAGSVLGANTLDTFTAITSTSGTKVLTNTDGTISWETSSETTPGGSDTQLQYNNGGAFGGASAITYDDSDGSVAFQNTADSTTAVQINKADGTTNVLSVDTTNSRVGIGTASPGYTLDVSGNANASGTITSNTLQSQYIAGLTTIGLIGDTIALWSNRLNLQNSSGIVWSSNSNFYGTPDISLSRFAANKLAVGNGTLGDSSGTLIAGNVGIGTTSPQTPLHINNATAALRIQDTVAGIGSTEYIEFYDSASRSGYIGFGDATTSDLIIRNERNADIMLTADGGDVLVPYGNVGIGTASPAELLHVSGNANFGPALSTAPTMPQGSDFSNGRYVTLRSNAVNEDVGLLLRRSADDLIGLDMWADTSGGDTYIDHLWPTVTSGLHFRTYAANGYTPKEVMFLNSAGNVGIGTTSPMAALHVVGNITSPGSGSQSEKFGYGAVANGDYSMAIGYLSTTGTYTDSLAVGHGAIVSGNLGTAIGRASTAASTAIAVGYGANASGSGNTAIGYSATASNVLSSAFGGSSTASGERSMALGQSAQATATGAIAIGQGSLSNIANTLVVGGDDATEVISSAYFGKGIVSAAPLGFSLNPTGGSGTNIAGASMTLAGGKATGNAAGGSILFQTSDAGDSGTTLQSLTTKMTILANGNVGIGTTNPSQRFESDSDSVLYAGYFYNSNAAGNGLLVDTNNADSARYALRVRVGVSQATEALSVRNDGNVGVGTITPTNYANYGQIAVNGATGSLYTSMINGTESFRTQVDAGNGIILLGIADLPMKFYTNNTQKMTILASGNVGIGTTSPSTFLHVLGTTEQLRLAYDSTYYSKFTVNSAGGLSLAPSADSTTAFNFTNATGTSVMNVDTTNRRVGIGTTAPGAKLTVNNSSDGQLLVYGYSSNTGGGVSDNSGEIRLGSSAAYQGRIIYDGVEEGDLYIANTWNNDNGGIIFQTKTAATAVNAMVIQGTGNVGIGTTEPGYPLDVQAATGQAMIKSTTGTNFSMLRINNTGGDFWIGRNDLGGTGLLSTGGVSYGAVLNATGTNPLQLAVNSAAAMTILNGGNVGIGTTSPQSKLQVAGTLQFQYAGKIYDENDSRTLVQPENGVFDILNEAGNAFGTLRVGTIYGGLFDEGNLTLDSTTSTTKGYVIMQPSGGNVGIGTTSPSRKLEVNGGDGIRSAPGTSNRWTTSLWNRAMEISEESALLFSTSGNTFGIGQSTDAFYIGYSVANDDSAVVNYPLIIDSSRNVNVNSGQLYVQQSTGNVGIGTTSPGAVLDIRGATASDAMRIGDSSIGYYKIGRSTTSGYLDFSGTQAGYTGYQFTADRVDILGTAGTVATLGQSDLLKLTRPNLTSTSYPQVVTFSVGRYTTPTTFSPNTRLDINLKNVSDNNYTGDTTVMTLTSAGNVGIGTTSPTYTLSLGGNVARTIWMERNTTTSGSNLTLSAGGGLSGGTNLNGGSLYLSSGIATGSGSSDMFFQTATAGASGTTDITPSTKFKVRGNGSVVVGTGTALATDATAGFLYIPSSAGTPTGTPVVDTVGTVPIQYDTTNNALYAYRAGGWRAIAETGGFQIPDFETTDPISGEKMQEGDFVLGMVDKTMPNDNLHGIWVTWSSVKAQLLAEARGELSSSGSYGTGEVSGVETETFLTKVTNTLFTLGISAKDGLVSIANLAVKKSDTDVARIKKMEMVDANTGEIYCTWIANGEWVKTKGDCTSSDIVAVSAVATTPQPSISQAPEIIEQAQQAASNALETVQNAQQAIQEQAQEVVQQAANSADKAAKDAIKEVKEEIKQEVKQELQQEAQPALETVETVDMTVEETVETPVAEEPEPVPEPEPEPEVPSVGEIIQESAASLINAVIDFLKGIIKLTIKKVASLPIMKNATASILQNSEKLKDELSSDRIPEFTAGLLSPMQSLINRLISK